MIFYKTLRLILIISLFSTFFSGCDKQIKPAPTISRDESGIPVYEVDQTYADEDLNDPEFNKYPRLQFVWNKRNGELPVLMSIRTDGTDLRRVIDSEKLFYGGASHFTHKPVRSANRRYLAYSNTATGISLPDRVIYDLKTNERITIIKSQTGTAQYFWSPDSENLFFHGDEMYRYHIQSKTLHQLPEFIYGAGFYALPDNKTIIAVTPKGVTVNDYDGKLKSETDLNIYEYSSVFFDVSPDGSHFIYLTSRINYLFNLKKDPELMYKFEVTGRNLTEVVFNADNTSLYAKYNRGLAIFYLKSKNITMLAKFQGSIHDLTRMYLME